MQAPCKDCPDRHYLCHSTCEKYIAYDKSRKELSAKRMELRRISDDLWYSSRRSKRKQRR